MNTPLIETTPDIGAPNSAVSSDLEQTLRCLERVRTADRSAAGDEDRLAWVDRVREVQRRADALCAVLIGEADEAGSAMRARHTHLQDWLARSGQQTPRQATGALWAARELEQRPGVKDAASAGRISLGQARAINEALNALPAGLDPGQRQAAEGLILVAAEHAPAEKLRGMTDALVRQVAPGDADSPELRAERLEARDARARHRRCLRFGPEADGSIDFSGSLPVVDGRRLQQLVQGVADRCWRSAKDTHDRARLAETPQQRQADALLLVVDAAQAAEAGPSPDARSRARRGAGGAEDSPGRAESDASSEAGMGARLPVSAAAAQLQVLIPYTDLLNRAAASGVLADGTPVSASELRRLACSADLVPVVLDTGSTILDVGRTRRLAPPPLRTAIGLRDGGCAFPGCGQPMQHCDIHHIQPWQENGPTTMGNLVALCRVHHSLIEPVPAARRPDGTLATVDQWQVRIDSRGLPEFTPPAATDPARTPIRQTMNHAASLLDSS